MNEPFSSFAKRQLDRARVHANDLIRDQEAEVAATNAALAADPEPA